MKKKVVIADVASIKLNNKIFGHYSYVTKMYCNLLSHTNVDISVAGGPIYSTDFEKENLMELPYDFELNELSTKCGRLRFKVKSVLNGIRLFKMSKGAIVICQPYSFISWMAAVIFAAAKDSEVYLIEYRNELDKKLNRFLFKHAKKKINGVICPNKEVGKCYDLPYITIPDYIYDGDDYLESCSKPEYDFGMFGIMSSGKDINDVMQTFSVTTHKVLIAGYFGDQDGFKRINEAKSKNITIINRYLTDDEFNCLIGDVKYVLLPYNDNYKNASSGVIFDALFRHKPVIARDLPNFLMVEKNKLGYLYKVSLRELDFDNLLNNDTYEEIQRNIEKYLEINRKAGEKMIKFLVGEEKT